MAKHEIRIDPVGFGGLHDGTNTFQALHKPVEVGDCLHFIEVTQDGDLTGRTVDRYACSLLTKWTGPTKDALILQDGYCIAGLALTKAACIGGALAATPAAPRLEPLGELAGCLHDGCQNPAAHDGHCTCYLLGASDEEDRATARPTAPAATAGAWVAVGEALPEASDDYSDRVLCYGNGGIDGPQFVAYYCSSLRMWFLAHDNQPAMTVTHWQPLPLAPADAAR